MDINIKDTITLNDDNVYVVIGKATYQGGTYYYLIDKNNNENIKFCVENTKKSSLIEIEDSELIRNLLPLFLNSSSKAITKEDINFMMENQ